MKCKQNIRTGTDGRLLRSRAARLATSLLLATALPLQPALSQEVPITTRVFLAPTCLITTEPPPPGQSPSQFIPALAAIVVPVLLGYAIDAVVANLREIRKETSAGSLDYNLYTYDRTRSRYPQWNVRQGCVTVITARSASRAGEVLDVVTATSSIDANSSMDDIRRRLTENEIGDIGDIYSIFEAELDTTEDQTAFRFVPRYYRLNRMLPGDRRRRQGVAYNLSMLGPGATPNGTQYASAVVEVGEVTAPTTLHFRRDTDTARLERMTTGYLRRPGLTPAAYSTFLRLARQDRPPIANLVPVTFRAELVQTIKPSDVARFAATILSGARAGLVAAAGTELAPSDPAAERQKVLNATVALRTAEAELAEAQVANNPGRIALAEAKKQAAEDLLNSLQ